MFGLSKCLRNYKNQNLKSHQSTTVLKQFHRAIKPKTSPRRTLPLFDRKHQCRAILLGNRLTNLFPTNRHLPTRIQRLLRTSNYSSNFLYSPFNTPALQRIDHRPRIASRFALLLSQSATPKPSRFQPGKMLPSLWSLGCELLRHLHLS